MACRNPNLHKVYIFTTAKYRNTVSQVFSLSGTGCTHLQTFPVGNCELRGRGIKLKRKSEGVMVKGEVEGVRRGTRRGVRALVRVGGKGGGQERGYTERRERERARGKREGKKRGENERERGEEEEKRRE